MGGIEGMPVCLFMCVCMCVCSSVFVQLCFGSSLWHRIGAYSFRGFTVLLYIQYTENKNADE